MQQENSDKIREQIAIGFLAVGFQPDGVDIEHPDSQNLIEVKREFG